MASEVEPDDKVVEIHRVITNVSHVTYNGYWGGLSASQMVFVAPLGGAYSFHVTSIANGNGASPIVLFLNDDLVLSTARTDEDAFGVYPLGSLHITLALERGDTVTLKARPYKSYVASLLSYYSPSDVIFTGFLVSARS